MDRPASLRHESASVDLTRYRECAKKYLIGVKMDDRPLNPSHIGILYQMARCINSSAIDAIESLRDALDETKDRELPFLVSILTLYALLAVFGCVGNGLVVFTVCRRRPMRTERNFYICNLAVSDFILCAVTQPLNTLRLLQNYISWEYGITLCRAANMLTGLNMFVSTFSITAVAVDRCRTVMSVKTKGPSAARCDWRRLALSLLAIWGSATLAASPLAVFPAVTENPMHKPPIKICMELVGDPVINWSKLVYSVATILVQYLMPLVIVLVAYARIYKRLQRRMLQMRRRRQSVGLRHVEARRQRRANLQLLAISLTFALSWLPLSVVNIVQDFNLLKKLNSDLVRPTSAQKAAVDVNKEETSTFMVLAAQCIPLLLILVSACLNPVFYGWLNDKFQSEFKRYARKILCRTSTDQATANSNTAVPVSSPISDAVIPLHDIVSVQDGMVSTAQDEPDWDEDAKDADEEL